MCITCGRIRKGDCRSTGNFTDHYEVHHPELVQKLKDHRSKKEAESTLEKNNRQQSMAMFTKPVDTEKVVHISNYHLFSSLYSNPNKITSFYCFVATAMYRFG